ATNVEIDWTIDGNGHPELAQFGQIYQADLAKIGVKLNIATMDLAAWVDAVATKLTYKGTYATTDSPMNLSPSTLLTSTRSPTPNTNHSLVQSARYMQLGAAAGTETDPAKLKQLYADINDLILDESFAIPLANNPIIMTGRSNVRDVTPNLHGGYSF